MTANCLNLYYGVISTSSVTNKHVLLASALQMAREIKLRGNLIQFTPLN